MKIKVSYDNTKQTPYYKLVESYAKPNGYIGVGMHSADRFMETHLQDGEATALLLSYYAIPKDTSLVKNFVAAMRDDEVLEHEFMFYPPARIKERNKHDGYKLCNAGDIRLGNRCRTVWLELLSRLFAVCHGFV